MNLREATVKAENMVDTIMTSVTDEYNLDSDWYGDNYHSMLVVYEYGFETDLFKELVNAYWKDDETAAEKRLDQIREKLKAEAKDCAGETVTITPLRRVRPGEKDKAYE